MSKPAGFIDYEKDTIKFGDDEFCYWWEDMRAREVRELVEDAWEAGYAYAKGEK